MRVILRREVRGVGKTGEVREVADGYALNFLIPRGLAVRASAEAVHEIERQRESAATKRERQRAELRQLARRIEATSLSFTLKGGAPGRVFGSITNRDIADALSARGIEVERSQVHLAEPLRQLGTHRVEVRLLPDVRATLTVRVEASS